MIEVELRSLITESKYNELQDFFENNAKCKGIQKQITSYFNCEQDLRLMTTAHYCQLWLKKGKIHDCAREEMIVKIDKTYKESLMKIFKEIGFGIKIKWFRIRKSYEWNNIRVDLDYTAGYGHILEFEILVEKPDEVENAKNYLMKIFNELKIEITDKQIFDEKFKDYELNWRKYTKDIIEEKFL